MKKNETKQNGTKKGVSKGKLITILVFLCILIGVTIFVSVKIKQTGITKPTIELKNKKTDKKENATETKDSSKSANDENAQTEDVFEQTPFVIKSLDENVFLLKEDSRETIADYVSNWSGQNGKYTKTSAFFDNIKIVPDYQDVIEVNLENPVIYVFSPEFQGICDFGFCDKTGSDFPCNNFIALFTEKGELLHVSDKGYSKKQNFSIQLSTNDICYIVLGRMLQNESDFDACFYVRQNSKNGFYE